MGRLVDLEPDDLRCGDCGKTCHAVWCSIGNERRAECPDCGWTGELPSLRVEGTPPSQEEREETLAVRIRHSTLTKSSAFDGTSRTDASIVSTDYYADGRRFESREDLERHLRRSLPLESADSLISTLDSPDPEAPRSKVTFTLKAPPDFGALTWLFPRLAVRLDRALQRLRRRRKG